MRTAGFAFLAVLIIVFQALAPLTAEETSCVAGFQSDMLIFKVTRKHLRSGTRLGKVGFTDCTDRTRFLFHSNDSRFRVQTNGIVTLSRRVVLHEGHQDFNISSWDSQGRKMTVPVRVVHDGHHHGHHDQNVEHDHGQNHANNTERGASAGSNGLGDRSAEDPQASVLHFPKSGEGLRRRKRDWVVPDLAVVENDRGPYPLRIAQIRTNEEKIKKISYIITGPGADQPPYRLFTMDITTGNLYLTQPLDREIRDKYTFLAHAMAEGAETAEDPMDIVVNVIDQNDNKPTFAQDTFVGAVPEASPTGFEVIKVEATDDDQPNTDNSDIRYYILSQEPQLPSDRMFVINPVTGVIRVNSVGLDKKKYPQYTLVVQAADMVGEGLTGQAKVILKVTVSNFNAPDFTQDFAYEATVEENKVDALVVTMSVTDVDEPNSPAWNVKFKIVDGDPEGLFTLKTGSNKQEGIISTAKGLDFEKTSKHTLLVTVENELPFSTPLPTSTATVVVNVEDVNEAPVFDPKEKLVSIPEDLAIESEVVQYKASEPDTARRQKVMYKIVSDPAGWLNVAKETGLITVNGLMESESHFVKDNKYTALIAAYDDDEVPATGTGTLVIELEDVDDNVPN